MKKLINKAVYIKDLAKANADRFAITVMTAAPAWVNVAFAAAKEETATDNSALADKINTFMNSIYALIVKLTSVSAGTAGAVCLFLMFFSKSSKTVEESTGWLKRIIICWAGIVFMSLIIGFINTNLGSAQQLTTTQ